MENGHTKLIDLRAFNPLRSAQVHYKLSVTVILISVSIYFIRVRDVRKCVCVEEQKGGKLSAIEREAQNKAVIRFRSCCVSMWTSSFTVFDNSMQINDLISWSGGGLYPLQQQYAPWGIILIRRRQRGKRCYACGSRMRSNGRSAAEDAVFSRQRRRPTNELRQARNGSGRVRDLISFAVSS